MPLITPRIKLTTILLLFSFFFFSEAGLAQFSVRASAGAAHLPLRDWSNFFGQLGGSFYQKQNPNILYGLSLCYKASEHHSLTIGTEMIRTSASVSLLFIGLDAMGDTTFVQLSTIKWKFRGIPITLGYEYKFPSANERLAPLVGIGASYFFSEAEAEDINPIFPQKLKRTGHGYGLHGSIGLDSKLSRHVSAIWLARYRYSDGMAFTDNEGDIKIEFTGFDFSVGLGLNF